MTRSSPRRRAPAALLTIASAIVLTVEMVGASPRASAQAAPGTSDARDREARSLFEAGRTAFADGRFDIAAISSGNLFVASKRDGAGFALPERFPIPQPGSARDLATGDIDGDGLVDVAIGSREVPIALMPASSTTEGLSFGPATTLGTSVVSLALGDLDSDGIADLAWADDADEFTVQVARGSRDAGFGAPEILRSDLAPLRLTFATLSAGRRSIVVASRTGMLSRIDNGDAGLARVDVPDLAAFDVRAADVDGDGIDEIIAAGPSEEEVQILAWSGSTVTRMEKITLPAGRRRYATVDVDGDGDLDLAVLLETNELALLVQTCAPPRDAGAP